MENQEDTKLKDSTTALQVGNPAQLEALKVFGNEILKSGLTPLKTGEAIVAAILFGKELGLNAMMSVNNIYPINGKATAGIHLINALLIKAGVVTKIIRDYEPCVAFAMKGEDGKATLYDENGATVTRGGDGKAPQGVKASPQISRIGFADEAPRDYEIKGTKIVNFKTVVEMTRKVKQPNNTYTDMTIQASFSWQEAVEAGLSEKANWKYPRVMCMNRACAFCGRQIAPDALLGLYETSELADIHNIPYSIQEDKVVIINDKSKSTPSSETNITDVTEENTDNETKDTSITN